MAAKLTNCAQVRERMPDAASASLADGILTAFDAHLRDCAACQDEFRRVQILLRAIDHTLSTPLSVEPSTQLVANVLKNIRQNAATQPHHAKTWKHRTAWATAAGVCAAVAILLFVARTSHKLNSPRHNPDAVQISASSTSRLTTLPTLHPSTDATALSLHPRKPAPTRALDTSLRATRRNAAKPEINTPEVIVQPGQMQAILQLVAATQTGKVDGADLLASQKKAANPLDVKPLVIASLKIAPLDNQTSTASGNSEDGDKDAGHSK